MSWDGRNLPTEPLGKVRLPAGQMTVPATVWVLVALTTIVAGLTSPGAGLGVYVLGLLAAVIIDFTMWLEAEGMVERD
ncbi:MAG: hypothetical protein K6T74_00690 [Geminicoccaceae bacterium]|jgi:hypothetical protein|nr:hypothetical protein [Geminicoccaceae bacterium]